MLLKIILLMRFNVNTIIYACLSRICVIFVVTIITPYVAIERKAQKPSFLNR